MNNRQIRLVGKPYMSLYRQIYKVIKKFERIAVFAHESPDFDALGTQLGLSTWLKDNFPEKDIRAVGQDHVSFTPRLYPPLDVVDDVWFDRPFLALIVDTGNANRVADKRFTKATFKVKIDHHPAVEQYGNLNLVNTGMAAASELIANMVLNFPGKHKVTKLAASYLYAGIAGDSGRFQYSSTTGHTFAIAQVLVNTGLDLSRDVYQKMYQRSLDDLYVTAYILGHFETSKNGIAYYVLSQEVQDKLKITVERGKENVNLFANIDGINAWCAITEDTAQQKWRVSIRSKEKAINDVASKFGGGGHAQASGASIKNLEELPKLIEALDQLFAQ